MTYSPAYPRKPAPGKGVTGYIAWDDNSLKPFHLKHTGSSWEARPIKEKGRVEPGFTTGEPVAVMPTLDEVWYHVASGGKESYSKPVVVELSEDDQTFLKATKKYPKASRDAIRHIAEARSKGVACSIELEPVAAGTPEEYNRFTATRTIGDPTTAIVVEGGRIARKVITGTTIAVEQHFTVEGGKTVASAPAVTVTEDHDGKPVVIIHQHRLSGAKHLSWFFTEDVPAVASWISSAKRALQRGDRKKAAAAKGSAAATSGEVKKETPAQQETVEAAQLPEGVSK